MEGEQHEPDIAEIMAVLKSSMRRESPGIDGVHTKLLLGAGDVVFSWLVTWY